MMTIDLAADRPREPFHPSADPDVFFETPAVTAVFRRLIAALETGTPPLAVLTGPPGTGKTTLLRRLSAELERSGWQTVIEGLPLGLDDLRDRLAAAEPGRRVVVGLDEAQALSSDLLVALDPLLVVRARSQDRCWWASPCSRRSSTRCRLGGAAIRESVRCRLAPLDADGVRGYVDFRWRTVRGGAHPFAPEAVERIAAASDGIPQMINLMCGLALRLAELRGIDRVTAELVDEATGELPRPEPRHRVEPTACGRARRRPRRMMRAAMVAAVVIPPLLVGGGLLLRQAAARPCAARDPPPPAARRATAGAGRAGVGSRRWRPSPRPSTVTSAPGPSLPRPPLRSACCPRRLRRLRHAAAATAPPRQRVAEPPVSPGPHPAADDAAASQSCRPRVEAVAPLHRRAADAAAHAAARGVDSIGGARREGATRARTRRLLRRAEYGDLKAVQALLLGGASPEARDPAGFTPLMLAVIHGHPAIVDALIAGGGRVNVQNRRGAHAAHAGRDQQPLRHAPDTDRPWRGPERADPRGVDGPHLWRLARARAHRARPARARRGPERDGSRGVDDPPVRELAARSRPITTTCRSCPRTRGARTGPGHAEVVALLRQAGVALTARPRCPGTAGLALD